MADVPDEAIIGRIEHIVDRRRQLDHAEPGTEVAARHRHGVDHFRAQLIGELAQLRLFKFSQIGGFSDGVEKRRFDLLLHLFGEQPEDAALARDAVLALEGGRHDDRAEVTTAAGRTGVTGVEVALVDNLDVIGGEPLAELGFDVFAAVHGRGG